jgi:hypothetical protein
MKVPLRRTSREAKMKENFFHAAAGAAPTHKIGF